MPRKDKVIHISNLPSTFRGNVTCNGRFIQNGIPPLGGAYDKVAKSTGLIRLGNEFLYNGVNNLVSKDNREKLMNNTAGRLINYVKDLIKNLFLVMMNLDQHFHLILFKLLEVMEKSFLKSNMLLVVKYQM